MREAFAAPPSSVLDTIERLTGTRSAVLLRDAPEDASPIALRVTRETAADDSRYQILGEIARGGIGVVYKGRDKDLGRDVALKVLRPEYAESPETLKRFVEEAQIGGQLQHPGLVPVYGMGLQADGRPYFAMRLIKGETLTAMMPGADRARLVAIFEQVAQTVAYAHSRGVVHRDLKPSNVMVGAFGEVQVVDWGFAKVLGAKEREGRRGGETVVATVRTADEGSHSMAGSVMGTPAYMPPEQALGHVDVLDERTDVFALGAILCEILTREPVYGGGRSDQILAASQARLDAALGRLAACDAHDDLKSLARDCLAPLPKDRPAHAGAVAQRVHDHLTSVEERARAAEVEAVDAEARADHERYRRRRTIAVAASLLLAIALGGGAFLWRQAQARARAGAAAPLVAAAMREATAHEGAQAWPAAVGAAAKAVDLAETAGADDALLASARALAARVREEEAAAQADARRRAEDEALLAALDEALAPSVDEIDARRIDAACVATLGARGFDLSRPSAIAERLGRSHVAAEIAADLDALARVRKRDGGDWKVLDDLARAIDPVALNDAFRDAWISGDLAALRDAALRADIDALPGDTLANLGSALRNAGDADTAVAFLRRCRDRRPGEWRIQANLGSLLPRGDPEASRAYAAVVALRPRSAAAWNGYGALLPEGDGEDKIAAFREAVRLDPSLGPAWYNRATTLARLGDHAAALPGFREAIRLRPDFAAAHAGLGATLLHMGDVAGGIAAVGEAIRLDPDSAIAHANLGGGLFAAGRLDEAIAACREAIRIDPNRPDAHVNLGSALKGKGDFKGAIAAYREGLRLDPDHADVHKDLGVALARSGAREEALAEFREALRLKPDFADAHCQIGNVLVGMGNLDGAIAAYREAIRADPGWVPAHHNLGFALRAKGDIDGAIAAYRDAIRVKPDHADAHLGLGIALMARKDIEGAVAAYREALRLRPEYPEALHNLGNALAARGEVDAAIAAYREAIRIRPEYALAYRQLGVRLSEKGDDRGAVAAWREAIRIQPDLGAAHADLGRAFLIAGDLDNAITESREAIRLDPEAPEVYRNIGLALSRQGRFQEALPYLKRGYELGLKYPGRDSPSQAWVDRCARMAELESRLPAVLDGSARPGDADERVQFAQICFAKKLYADSARLYGEAVAEDPALADDPRNGLRYDAACAAAMAGSRAQALAWLRADLAAHANGADRAATLRTLEQWAKDPDLASVRDRIDDLPEAEREGWKKLWADVDALREGK
jgi:tetratricopeptide (TPR) repeat protein/predicted Ser/Thr protein kinase